MRDATPNLLLAVALLTGGGCANKDDADAVDTGSSGEVSTDGETSGTSPTSATASTSTSTTAATTTGESQTTAASAEGSSGGATSTGEPGTSSSSGSPSDLHAVSGTVTRSVEPADGNDGVGDLYISVVDACDFSFDLVVADVLTRVDTGAGVDYVMEGIPDGTWYFIAFLDDDGDAELPAPMPDQGDLAASDGSGIGCAEFTIDGDDVDGVDLALDFVIPF